MVISAPIRISQSAVDQRVRAESIEISLPPLPAFVIRGVDALAEEELPQRNPDNPPLYVRYECGEVMVPQPDPDGRGAHFALLNHDRDPLPAWLAERFAG